MQLDRGIALQEDWRGAKCGVEEAQAELEMLRIRRNCVACPPFLA